MEISQEDLDKQIAEALDKGKAAGASAKASELQAELTRVKTEAAEKVSKMETEAQRKVSEQADELGTLRKAAESFTATQKERDEYKTALDKIETDKANAEKKAKEAEERKAARPKEILASITDEEVKAVDAFLAGDTVPQPIRDALKNEETKEATLAVVLEEMRSNKPPEKGKETVGIASEWLQSHKRTIVNDPEAIRETLKEALKKTDHQYNRMPGMPASTVPGAGDDTPTNASGRKWTGDFKESAQKSGGTT